jgi:hypothetical protein
MLKAKNRQSWCPAAASRVRVRVGLVATALVSSLGVADTLASERQQVTEINPLLQAALDRGEAHGVLVGASAQWITQYFTSTAPIEIDVKTVSPLSSHPGCMRLAITTTQEGVWDYNRQQRAAAPERKAFTWMVNYCRDGSLPTGKTK